MKWIDHISPTYSRRMVRGCNETKCEMLYKLVFVSLMSLTFRSKGSVNYRSSGDDMRKIENSLFGNINQSSQHLMEAPTVFSFFQKV